MTVTEVLQNLDNTIDGKEQMLANLEIPMYPSPARTANEITAQFLAINIAELKRIREDVSKIN